MWSAKKDASSGHPNLRLYDQCIHHHLCCSAYVWSFVRFGIQGVIHPMVARWIWAISDSANPAPFATGWLSPYQSRYCLNQTQFEHLNETADSIKNMYVLDFAGGGAVHLLGQ